jgi:hypothetical protein
MTTTNLPKALHLESPRSRLRLGELPLRLARTHEAARSGSADWNSTAAPSRLPSSSCGSASSSGNARPPARRTPTSARFSRKRPRSFNKTPSSPTMKPSRGKTRTPAKSSRFGTASRPSRIRSRETKSPTTAPGKSFSTTPPPAAPNGRPPMSSWEIRLSLVPPPCGKRLEMATSRHCGRRGRVTFPSPRTS